MLFFTDDNYTNGYIYDTTYFLIFIAIISGIYVIISSNPIYSVLYLIALFAAVAIFLIMNDLNFIGISYLLVYVGAVTILFLFILMLINIRRSELADHTRNNFPLGFLITIFFIFPITNIISINTSDIINFTNILNVFSNSWEFLAEYSDIASLGNIMYAIFSLWLIITSLILLLGMVGAIVITLN